MIARIPGNKPATQSSTTPFEQAPEQPPTPTVDASWLRIILQGTSNEVSIVAMDTLRFIDTNPATLVNLQYSAIELHAMQLHDIAPELTPGRMHRLLAPLRAGTSAWASIDTMLVRKDASSYPAELRFHACADNAAPVLVILGKDISARDASAAALGLIEARFQAIVSNTPGLVYQFRLMHDNAIAFTYLSEGCHALLGVSPDQLNDNPGQFLELILPQDRAAYLESMRASAAGSTSWNWEGRIWIEAWKDIKWINLRATPRALPDHCMQWEGIMTNITASKREEDAIKRSSAQLAELSAHVERVKEEERTRIAREIHDDLGGNLTAIKMALALLKKRLPGDASLTDKVDYADLLVDRTIESIHRISVDLRPSVLDFGIVAAIKWQAREFEKQLGIPCEVLTNQSEIVLPPDQASALFRIFQESLTNISKHADASSVNVRLTRSNRGIRMEISDNGKGIATRDQLKPKSFGILGMAERAKAFGGSLSVSKSAGGGSVVALRIPLPAALPENAGATGEIDETDQTDDITAP